MIYGTPLQYANRELLGTKEKFMMSIEEKDKDQTWIMN